MIKIIRKRVSEKEVLKKYKFHNKKKNIQLKRLKKEKRKNKKEMKFPKKKMRYLMRNPKSKENIQKLKNYQRKYQNQKLNI